MIREETWFYPGGCIAAFSAGSMESNFSSCSSTLSVWCWKKHRKDDSRQPNTYRWNVAMKTFKDSWTESNQLSEWQYFGTCRPRFLMIKFLYFDWSQSWEEPIRPTWSLVKPTRQGHAGRCWKPDGGSRFKHTVQLLLGAEVRHAWQQSRIWETGIQSPSTIFPEVVD